MITAYAEKKAKRHFRRYQSFVVEKEDTKWTFTASSDIKLVCGKSRCITSHIMFVPNWETRTSSSPPLMKNWQELAGNPSWEEPWWRGTQMCKIRMTQAAYVMCIPLLRVNHSHSSCVKIFIYTNKWDISHIFSCSMSGSRQMHYGFFDFFNRP